MITFDHMVEATFIRRVNRFIAEVVLKENGALVTAHLANTGRMTELLVEGRRCLLSPATHIKRKTKWDLFFIEQDNSLVCLRAAFANRLVADWLHEGFLPPFHDACSWQTEYRLDDHRFDFYLHFSDHDCLLEVKSVNYVVDGMALFPDAPTKRGLGHVQTLIGRAKEGKRAAIVFVTMGQLVDRLTFNRAHDPAFAEAMEQARDAGVEIVVCEAGFTFSTAHLRGFKEIDWRRNS